MIVGILVKWLLHYAGDNQWFPMPMPGGLNQVTVHPSDELEGDLFGAHRFTLAMIGTTAEAFVGHRNHHAERPLVALGLTLRQRVEVGNFG